MDASEKLSYRLGLFLHLAQASLRRRRPLVRDRMLVLAAVLAANLEIPKLASHCRAEILQNNPHHLIGHWPTLGEAMFDEEFMALVAQLRRRYPVERAEKLLESLGIEIGNERDVYFSDAEYAASILGVSPTEFLADDSA